MSQWPQDLVPPSFYERASHLSLSITVQSWSWTTYLQGLEFVYKLCLTEQVLYKAACAIEAPETKSKTLLAVSVTQAWV